MTGRTLATAPAAAPEMRSRTRRNLILAILVPVLLAVAYLAGMSGADARTNAIPALIVNEDQMVEQQLPDGTTTTVVAGRLVVSHLTSPDKSYGFDWGLADAETAAAALESGEASVVVTIPEDFSASVVSLGTSSPQQAQLNVVTDQAHDYLAGQAARALAGAVIAEFGTDVTNMVAIGLVQGMEATADGFQEAADGAGQLASGADQLGEGFDTYTQGQDQITDGLGQSASGASQFADGVTTYVAGVGTFASGVGTYVAGVNQYSTGVDQYASGVTQFANGVTQYTAGVDQLADGLGQLNEGGAQLTGAADQIDGAVAGLSGVTDDIAGAQAYYDSDIKPALDELAGSADTLAVMCADLPDPAQQAECDAAAANVSTATGQATGFVDGLFSDTSGIGQIPAGIGQLTQLSDGLRQLGGGIGAAADGAAQLSDASVELNTGASGLIGASSELTAGGAAIRDGGATLAAGGSELAAGGGQLETGATSLSDGLAQLYSGQLLLTAGNPAIRDGMTGIGDGASQLQDGLQDGADQASGALGDPQTYAEALSHPVTASVDAQHDPSWGGMLASLAVPITAWVAALVTSLARRLITTEGLASTASTGRLVWRAARRLGLPVLLATLGVGLVGHFAGAPWAGLVGTLGIGALMAVVAVALHLCFVAIWDRRGAAIASLVAFAIQLVAVGGVLPLALRAGWVEALAGVSPLSHAAAGLQLVYAGGAAGGIVMSFVSLALIALIALGVAWLVVERKRATDLGHVVNLRALGLPLRSPDPKTP